MRDGRRCSRGVGAGCGLALAMVVVWSRSGFRSGAGPGALDEGPALELVRLGLERGRGQVGAGRVAQDVDAGLLGGHEWRAILLLLLRTVAGGQHPVVQGAGPRQEGWRVPGGRPAGGWLGS